MTFLQVNDVSHHFFTDEAVTTALCDIHFTLSEGEFVSFLGPSGCGKSTLLSIIAGLLAPTDGTLQFKHDSPEIGYMLQQDFLFPWKTIEDNVALGLTILKRQPSTIVDDLLESFELSHTKKLYPTQLSGGMRQRIALARTLAVNPSLLLLDEPFSALDYRSKLMLENFVAKTLQNYKTTTILVTHDISEAIAMSDKIFIFSPRPGTITQCFIIPQALRQLSPLESRNAPPFQQLFQQIWKELERDEP
ncbi:ABC transporter ATP-binding protein [Solibacillus sp. MA9]|uniref:ABC transporter ATP-binding protein n=1 Tax=Solibacillus palustris TaxID=2908203 RepID=A0ABS9UHL7_9BACL|nr:ABC transporter ATP-binding protein [Solibacillus sp. MA9]MCH7323836.1 ABC transporter ATP-binding protein [Solibacillus sp. MA9]